MPAELEPCRVSLFEPVAQHPSAPDRRDNFLDDATGIFLLRKLSKHGFERRLAQKVSKMLDSVVRNGASLSQNQNRRANFLDRFKHVRTVENHFSFLGQSTDERAKNQGSIDIEP